jgi:hypothetical protein
MAEAGENRDKPVIRVPHAELERTRAGQLASECPVCHKGVLAMKRDPVTLRLQAEDVCLYCGQRFFYTDIQNVV